jgi:diguanylate cyclase (GGDEF)-like protein/PAS domain S-box-containing protein
MMDRTELLEAALDSFPDGIALVGAESEVVFWNPAAEAITGYAAAGLLGRVVPGTLEPLLRAGPQTEERDPGEGPPPGCGALVHVRHKLGHDVPAMTRALVLRDGLGTRIGIAAVFHPAESLDALPHGERVEDLGDEANQAEFEDRLTTAFRDFQQGGETFGVLWITVDQAGELRRTHGASACESMFEKMEHALANGLRPAEQMGRWGDDEFLVLSHERTAEMLATHAQVLAGLARTADFRWWGDRIPLTVSIGAAQAEQAESLPQLLERAQIAMLKSVHAGGNHITAPGRQGCLPS